MRKIATTDADEDQRLDHDHDRLVARAPAKEPPANFGLRFL
jgi:hypothetical protein